MTLRSSPHRLSLRSLMALVAVFALGLGAMKTGSELVTVLSLWILLFTLLTGTLLAIVRRPSPQWLGFSLFGWSLSILVFASPVREAIERYASDPFAWLVSLSETMHPIPPGGDYAPRAPITMLVNGKRSWTYGGSYQELSAEENREYEAFEIVKDLTLERREARKQAPIIGEIFLIQTFACLGALLGRLFVPAPITRSDCEPSV